MASRLTSSTVGGVTTTYAYDGDGKRASQTTSSTTTSYAYDVNTSLPVVLTDGSRKYVYGLGLAYTVDSSGNAQVYHTDGLSSVRALTDGSGNVVETYQTDPFGVPALTQGTSAQPFQYTGQQVDGTGLVYLRARIYDPTIGRFLSRDSVFGRIHEPQGLNRYAYAQNNPVSYADPSGRDIWGDYAHSLIEAEFTLPANHPNFTPEVLHKDPFAPRNNPLLGSIRVDLEDRATGEFYEIKPITQEAEGRRQILRYEDFGRTNGLPLHRSTTPSSVMVIPTFSPSLCLIAFPDPYESALILYVWAPTIPIGPFSPPEEGSAGEIEEQLPLPIGESLLPCLSRVLK